MIRMAITAVKVSENENETRKRWIDLQQTDTEVIIDSFYTRQIHFHRRKCIFSIFVCL